NRAHGALPDQEAPKSPAPPMEKRVEFDLEYIREWSVWFDIKIVFLTVFKGFVNKAAY
ncbi:sugar transferase, partial [Pseudomonas aeruginosa]|uniref:sugar transferase n=1 Tax=Pseudomonas aeruginosa TaxID=287 RepID=UPI0031B6CD9C